MMKPKQLSDDCKIMLSIYNAYLCGKNEETRIRKMRKSHTRLVVGTLILMTAGCAQFPSRRAPVSIGPEPAVRPLISQEELTEKIVTLQKRLQENSISEADRPGAKALLEIYKLLQDASPSTGETGYRQLIARLYLRLGRVETAFQAGGNEVESHEKSTMDAFSWKRDKIVSLYLSGDSRGVINGVLALKGQFGPGAMTPEVSLVFACSLANQGLLKEAIEAGERAARELEQGPDLITLESKMATWYSRLGQEDAAMLRFEKVSDLMDDRTALLNNLKQDLQVRVKPQEPQEEEHISLPKVISMAEDQLQAHAFDQATRLLLQKRQDTTLSPSDLDTIDRTLERVEKAKEASLGREKKALEQIRDLMEKEKYDEALSMLEELKSEKMQGDEIASLELEAREGYINHERKKAAALFLRARTAGSSLEKKEYLRQSHDILQHLLDKFPSSPSRDKILQNLESVDRELAKW
jgi:tetratricopeptide (TPR) repeat protein